MMIRKLLLTATLSVAATSFLPAQADVEWNELDGVWESFACELRPQADAEGVKPWYLKRRITFQGGTIDAHFTTYADPGCTAALTDINFSGEVHVLGESDVAEGAKNVDLIINEKVAFTPQMQGFADFLNSAEAGTCGDEAWQLGVEQDVFKTGCSVMGMEPESPTQEFEVLFQRDGMLYFGARPVDGQPLASAELRPTALQIPLQRVSGGSTQLVGGSDQQQPGVVELVIFKQKKGADPEAIEQMLHGFTHQMNKFDTLLYRTIGHDGEGNWTCVNYWTDLAAMKTLNKDARGWESLKQFPELVDMSTFKILSYAIDYPVQ